MDVILKRDSGREVERKDESRSQMAKGTRGKLKKRATRLRQKERDRKHTECVK